MPAVPPASLPCRRGAPAGRLRTLVDTALVGTALAGKAVAV